MAYYDIALLSQDVDFLFRVAACYATETPVGEGDVPNAWAARHALDMASAPGFGDAYASALAGNVPNPGRDPSVISDNQILAAVQMIMAAETPGGN